MSFDELEDKAKNADTLNELFEIWKQAHIEESDENWIYNTKGTSENIPKNSFIGDGIIDTETFKNEKMKVLFISNEANIDDPKYEKVGDRREDFKEYYYDDEHYDSWKGKMRERICAVFNEIIHEPSPEFYRSAKRFSFMNINKRGGNNQIGDGSHIRKYCELYKEFIKKEIELIDPDLIVWLGIKTYRMNLLQSMGADYKGNTISININGHSVPIMKMWHTSNYRGSKKSLSNYNEVEKEYVSMGINNRLIIKLAAKARLEYDLLGSNMALSRT